MHLLIPFACNDAPGCADALGSLRLPHLQGLLQQLTPLARDEGPSESLSPPHERVLAGLQGLAAADGCIAWAAQEALQCALDGTSHAWAWISPAHWDVGAHHIAMADPQALGLDASASHALLQAMAPYFAEDGITLQYAQPARWLARGPVFDGLASAALDRVVGQDIQSWMPPVAALRRLQNEMQMLLYTHAVNDARAAHGQALVNSFWVSASGRLPPGAAPLSDTVTVAADLRTPALQGDWSAWAAAWQALDAGVGQQLARAALQGADVRLTLCGSRHATTLGLAREGLLARLARRWRAASLADLLATL